MRIDNDLQFAYLGEGSLFFEVGMRKVPWETRRPTSELVRQLFDVESPERRPPRQPTDEVETYLLAKLSDLQTLA